MAIAKVESGYGGKPYPFLIGLNGKDIKKGKKILAFKGRWLEHRSFDCLEEENCVNAGSALIEQRSLQRRFRDVSNKSLLALQICQRL